MNVRRGLMTWFRGTGYSCVRIAQGTWDNLTSLSVESRSGSPSLIIRDAYVWTGNGVVRGSILVEDGRISRIARIISERADEEIKARRLVALPGLVDAHVHLRDMRLSYKEDFTSGTAAAAAGGFTTVLDMPNTQPPTDSAERLLEKMDRASMRILVNVGFHVAATNDRKAARSMKTIGAMSMKLYLPKPISPLDIGEDRVIVEVMEAANRAPLPVTVHAEDATTFEDNTDTWAFSGLIRTRPGKAETKAVFRMLHLQKSTGCRVHFCHVTLPPSISAICASSDRVTSEVTPHHLFLADSDIRKLGWRGWMVPPLRSKAARNGLFRALLLGKVTMVATDHAPHAVREKKQSPDNSPPGVPGLETAMPLMLTMMNKGRVSLRRLVSLLSSNPARVFGLRRKGTLERGADGDLVLVDLKRKSVIDPEKFLSKAHYSPFEGWRTTGAIHTTVVNGRMVYSDGEIVGKLGVGRVLRAGRRA